MTIIWSMLGKVIFGMVGFLGSPQYSFCLKTNKFSVHEPKTNTWLEKKTAGRCDIPRHFNCMKTKGQFLWQVLYHKTAKSISMYFSLRQKVFVINQWVLVGLYNSISSVLRKKNYAIWFTHSRNIQLWRGLMFCGADCTLGWSDFLDSFPRFTNSAKSHLDPKSKFLRRSDARRFLARARKILTVLYTVGWKKMV